MNPLLSSTFLLLPSLPLPVMRLIPDQSQRNRRGSSLPPDEEEPSPASRRPSSRRKVVSYDSLSVRRRILQSHNRLTRSNNIDWRVVEAARLRSLRPKEPLIIPRAHITLDTQSACIMTGAYGDLYLGTHRREGKVAMKRLRFGTDDDSAYQASAFEREARTWQKLKHPHILKFFGIYQSQGESYMVSPFIPNGTLVEYLKLNPTANRERMVVELADAITYLHGVDIIHGDLKGQNVLISATAHVLLCDFGLTKETISRTKSQGAGSIRWQAPELWRGEPKTFASDVYGFGMTVYQILSGRVPFDNHAFDAGVIMAVAFARERPPNSPMVSSSGTSYSRLWDIASSCWVENPLQRPWMIDVFHRLKSKASIISAPTPVRPRSFAATAWSSASATGSGVRVYMPSEGGIQEVVCSNGGFAINGDQPWIRGAFLKSKAFTVPDDASITATNSFEMSAAGRGEIVVVFADAQGVMRSWEFRATTGRWKEGTFNTNIPRCPGFMTAVTCLTLSEGVVHHVFCSTIDGQIIELQRIERSWSVTRNVYKGRPGVTFSASVDKQGETLRKTLWTNDNKRISWSVNTPMESLYRSPRMELEPASLDEPNDVPPKCLSRVTLPGDRIRFFTNEDSDGDLIEWRYEKPPRPTIETQAGQLHIQVLLNRTNRPDEVFDPVLTKGKVYKDVMQKGSSLVSIASQIHGGEVWLYVFYLDKAGRLAISLENFLGWHPSRAIRVGG